MILGHIADIHIFLNKRHEEHKHVFNNLYTSLKENNVDRIAVLGDVFQSKTTLSPEAIETAYYFFLNLSMIAPVDIIVGNHDVNLKNDERLDSITPIVNTINTNKYPLKVYLKSGLYKITESINYGVFSCLDEENFPIEFNEEENVIYIALFHGPLSGVKLTDDFELENTRYSKDLFKNYNIAFCGDIHIQQELGNAHYSGSLLALDFSEGNREHGYLLWDINLSNHIINKQFIPIKNNWGFYDLKTVIKYTKDNIPVFENICKYPRIKLTIYGYEYSLTEKKELELAIREKYNPIELNIFTEFKSNQNLSENEKIGDVTKLSTQEELLKKYLKDHKDKEQVSRLIILNQKWYNEVPKENILKNIKWKFNSFKFNNIFSFGENNVFDFTKYKGIVLINGGNAKGKTNFFNSLLYTMFNTTDKTSDIKHIINYNKKECDGEILIDYNNEKHRIIRKSSKTSKSTSTSLDYTKFNNDIQQWISLNSDTRPNTDKLIQKTFGSYDDIIISSFSPQGKVSEFLDKGVGPAFLLDLISKFLGVNIYTDMYDLANKEYKKIKTIFDSFEKLDYANIILGYKSEIETQYSQIDVFNTDKTSLKFKILDLENLYEEEHKKIQTIPNNIKNLKNEESQLLKNIEDKKIIRETIKNTIKSLDDRKNSLLISLDVVDENLLKKKSDKIDEIKQIELIVLKLEKWLNENDKLKIQDNVKLLEKFADEEVKLELRISKKESETKKDLKQVDIINKQGWNDTEDLCKKCELYINAANLRNDVNKIKEEIELLLAEFDAKKKQVIDYTHWEEDLSKYEKRESELQQLHSKLKLEQSNLSKIELEIKAYLQKKITDKDKLISDIEVKNADLKTCDAELKNLLMSHKSLDEKNSEYEKYLEVEKNNEKINNILKGIKQKIETEKLQIDNLQYSIVSSEKRITELETKITQLEETLQKIKQYEELNSDYELYLKCMHREGIPYNIISMSIDIINSEVNKIIEQIENFRIYFEPDLDKKEIPISIHHPNGKSTLIQNGSGMEKTITALAIRDALVNISNIPRCNIFVMDESIQTFDPDHLSIVGRLFDYLRKRYDTVFTISHLEAIKDYADHVVNADNKNGYTKLEFLN